MPRIQINVTNKPIFLSYYFYYFYFCFLSWHEICCTPRANFFYLTFLSFRVYYSEMKRKSKKIKARVNRDGLMGSAPRVHRTKKGKGSFRRHAKHKKSA